MTDLPINQIVCGDCLEVMRGWPDGCVDAVVTDIPYNEVNRDSGGLRSLNKGTADSAAVDPVRVAQEVTRVSRGSIYVFCSTEQVSDIRRAFVAAGLTTRHGFWHKSNPSPMNGDRMWLSAVENCVFARKPRATFNRHCAAPVWRGPTCDAVAGFPCPKPEWLIAELVTASTNPGDLVLDPFIGSGTTAVVCSKLGRRFIGIELNPAYCETARRRVADAAPLLAVAQPEPAAPMAGLFDLATH